MSPPIDVKPVVAIVDPISTGASLAKFLSDRGYPLVRVFSDTLPDEVLSTRESTPLASLARLLRGLSQRQIVPHATPHSAAPSVSAGHDGPRSPRRPSFSTQVKALVAEGLEVDWRVTIQHEGPGRAAYTAAALRGVGVTHVIVGSEPGVSLHAELTSYFADSPVPAEKIELRRNKYLQSEAVRAAGIDAVHQTLAHTREDVEEFIRKVERSGAAAFKAVIKPVEGAGSDGVSICSSPDHVRSAYAALEGTKNVLGLTNYSVLLQAC